MSTPALRAGISWRRIAAMIQRYWYLLMSSWPRLLELIYWPALQIITFDDALFDGYASNVDFIQAYVFPGGLLLSERRLREIAARHGLAWREPHHCGASYAETLRRWRENFDAAVAADALPKQFDARFVALWRYYLMYCEGGFRGGGIDVLQVTLVKEGI